MSVRSCILRALLAAGMLGLVAQAQAQGFAGLGTAADGFAVPDSQSPLSFPSDHAPHPEFRIEWWYLTANLTDTSGRDLGVQWTLFRQAMAPPAPTDTAWSQPQVWMGHAAVTTADTHLLSEKFARGGIGQAGATLAPFEAWIDDWHMAQPAQPAQPAGADPLDRLTLGASGDGFSYDLTLAAEGPLVAHGDAGISVKSAAGQASYYYSQPFYTVTGTVTLGDDTREVSGRAWLDREWSSQPLAADQTGWDWVSLHLPDGAKLMAFRLRDGGAGYTSGTYIAADGTPTPVADGQITLTPLTVTEDAGRQIPTRWQLAFPARMLNLTLEALNPAAVMTTAFPYWEGPVRYDGSHQGVGYLEMTGY